MVHDSSCCKLVRNKVEGGVKCKRTVDGDGNSLVEGETISTDKGWDFAELVDLEVLSRDTLGWLGLDDIELDVIGLCNCTNGS